MEEHTTCEGNSLFKKGLGLIFMVVVHQFQIHVYKQWVENLGQLCSMTVQNCFYEPFQAAVVNLVQSWVSLLAVSRQNHIDIWLVLPRCY